MDQDATWYGDEGFGPGDIVLDGDAAPPQKGHSLPIFDQCPLWPNGWMDYKMPLGMEVGLGPADIVLDWDATPPPTKKGVERPIFGSCLL